ncbi:MAG: metal-sensitive transcriptional regulator [Brevinematia bacterium]
MVDINIEEYKPSHLSHEVKEKLRNRLSRAKGHLDYVIKMLDNDKACEDLVLQLSAVKSAINEVIVKILEAHIDMCMSSKGNCNNLDTLEVIKVLVKALKVK